MKRPWLVRSIRHNLLILFGSFLQSNKLGTAIKLFKPDPLYLPHGLVSMLMLCTFSHGFTYSEHPVACAVAMETHHDSTAVGADLVNPFAMIL
ncbi:hypothetical protein L6452_01674 [Arctium lappa]|uniref:Uncharacterized protein n=1 Tax=Arctium lappa TaxID=4217 RepID=A0ACB9FIC4_ARCLA|nr:hypothetical protein L6452_01674 [Arctium lappa]